MCWSTGIEAEKIVLAEHAMCFGKERREEKCTKQTEEEKNHRNIFW